MWPKTDFVVALLLSAAPAAVVAGENNHYQTMSEYEQRRMELEQKISVIKKEAELLQEQQHLRQLREQLDAPNPAPVVGDPAAEAAPDPLRKMTVHSITGVDGTLVAEIRYGSGLLPVKTGDALPGKWIVSKITPSTVTVRRGKRTRIIPLPEEATPPQATGFGAGLFPPPPPPVNP